MPHAALGRQRVGMLPYCRRWSAQNSNFQAIVMAKMHMRGCHAEIMMRVLGLHQPLRQVAQGVVVDIGECGHALRLAIGQMLLRCCAPHHLADRLGSAAKTPQRGQGVHLRQQVIVNGDGDALHAPRRRRFP